AVEEPSARVALGTILDDDQLPREWHNETNAYDVNQDGFVSPIDALLVVNELNAQGARALAELMDDHLLDIDSNNDGFISPLDALLVINELNRSNSSGMSVEGEPASLVDAPESALSQTPLHQSYALDSSQLWSSEERDRWSNRLDELLALESWHGQRTPNRLSAST
ncbi:MAG: dockerin type I domain-containing protein, partial [Planctomycetota bacterium]